MTAISSSLEGKFRGWWAVALLTSSQPDDYSETRTRHNWAGGAPQSQGDKAGKKAGEMGRFGGVCTAPALSEC